MVEIKKKFRISEIIFTNMENAPFQVSFGNESRLTMDKATCDRYGIPMDMSLVGRTLVCDFTSRQLPLQQEDYFKGFVDFSSIESDDLWVAEIKLEKTITVENRFCLPMKYGRTHRALKLNSFGGGDGIHPHVLPCPFYRFVFHINSREYKRLRKYLPPESVFKVDFHLLEEPIQKEQTQ